jgi:hypothetical protein
VDLLTQHVGHPARAVGSRSGERNGNGHVAKLMQVRAMFRPADRGRTGRVSVLRRKGFGSDLPKHGRAGSLRHLGCDHEIEISLS